MPSDSSDILSEVRKLLEGRLAELDDERKRLERALAELGVKKARRPGRPRGSGKPSPRASAPRRRRKRRGGTRAEQALGLIGKEPGISTTDLAKGMKTKPNYLYRVLADLEKEGRIKREGRKNYPAA